MFYTHSTQIRLKETDATGVIHFSQLFTLSLEALEAFLETRGFGLSLLFKTSYLIPIVHAEGDFFLPLQVGDRVEIDLEKIELGDSSIRCSYIWKKGDAIAGKALIVHVCVSREDRKKILLPDLLKEVLGKQRAGDLAERQVRR